MTKHDTAYLSAPAEALRALLAPVAPETFVARYWGRRSLHVRGPSDRFDALFDLDRFHVAVRRACERPRAGFRLAALEPKRPEDPLTLTTSLPISPGEIVEHLQAGHTICVNDIGAGDEGLDAFARRVRAQLGFAGSARFNCYLSLSGSGAAMHVDPRISTTLQIAGSKRWRYARTPAVAWPRSAAQIDHDGAPVWMVDWGAEEPLHAPEPAELEESVLEPGDLLCLPAGTWHEACAGEEGSLALNLSFGPASIADVIGELLHRRLGRTEPWRAGVPPAGSPLGDEVPETVTAYLDARLAEAAVVLASEDGTREWRRMLER